MYDLIRIVTSPFLLFVILCSLLIVSLAVGGSREHYRVLTLSDNIASGVSILLILVLAISFVDFAVTCRLLVEDRLLQFEFIVIAFFGLTAMAMRYIRSFE